MLRGVWRGGGGRKRCREEEGVLGGGGRGDGRKSCVRRERESAERWW